MRRMVVVVLVVLLAGCGDSPLTGLGERSSRWLGDDGAGASAPIVTEEAPTSELVPAAQVTWWNDGLSTSTGDPEVSLEDIAARRNPGDRFAQASRLEIAALFPDLEFPARVPADVQSVTSQLVLAATEPVFEGEHIASFGLWTSDPYTRSRTVGQLATLTVFDGASADPCGTAGADCSTQQVGARTVGRVVRSAGETIIWSDSQRTYEMFVRQPAAGAVPAMLASVTPISDLVDGSEMDAQPVEQTDEGDEPATVP